MRKEEVKRIVLAATGLVLVLAFTGCNLQLDQPTTVPKTPTANQNVTGVLAGISVAPPGGNATVTIRTSNGTQAFVVSPDAALTLGSKSCTIEELAAIQTDNTSYNCTVAYNDVLGVFGVYVTGAPAK